MNSARCALRPFLLSSRLALSVVLGLLAAGGATLAQADEPRPAASAAPAPEIAALETLARGFKRVAQQAKAGVVSLRVKGGEAGGTAKAQAERMLREILADKMERDEIDAIIREYRDIDSSAERKQFVFKKLEKVLDPPERQMLYWMMQQIEQQAPGSGSGFLIDAQGYILTNNHVVENRTSITVTLADGREANGEIVGADSETDLAVIKITESGLTPLPLADSDQLEVGEWVLAVGAPFGLEQTVTHGIVSALGRKEVRGLDITYQNFIQTDAAVNPGNSGGPLLNLRGEVVGVNTAIASPGTGSNAGIAFTIPINMAIKVARQLRASGKVARGFLGVLPLELRPGDETVFAVPAGKGVWIDEVTEGSPADKSGIRVEDVVVAINGKSVTEPSQFREVVADLTPNEPAVFQLIRERRPITVQVRLADRSESARGRTRSGQIGALPLARLGGMRGYSLRPGLSSLYSEKQRGVVIAQRIEAVSNGLGANDLVVECEGRPVRSVLELNEVLLGISREVSSIRVRVLEPGGDERLETIRLQE